MESEELVSMFYNDTVYSFVRANEITSFAFGGPIENDFTGQEFGPHPFQMAARFSLDQIPEVWKHHRSATSSHPLWRLPLVYGFCYDGCSITYRVAELDVLDILEVNPSKSCDDWPYRNFPSMLPYVPLKLSGSRSCSYAEFADGTHNLANEQPAEMVVTVPPPATIGVSLWGWSGDAEGTTVVFECNLTKRTINAYNVY